MDRTTGAAPSASQQIVFVIEAMKAGAFEFLSRPFDEEVLLSALRQALERSDEALHRESEMRTLRDRYGSLSLREREVMTLVATGRLNKQVGAELGKCEITVKAHRGHLMRKMSASSLAELVMIAATLGLGRASDALAQNRLRVRRGPVSRSAASDRYHGPIGMAAQI